MYQNPKLWARVRKRILQNGESISHVAMVEGISRPTIRKMLRHEKPVGYGGKPTSSTRIRVRTARSRAKTGLGMSSQARWQQWLVALERRDVSDYDLPEDVVAEVLPVSPSRHVKAMTVLARAQGFSISDIANFLSLSRVTVKKYANDYAVGGTEALYSRPPKTQLKNDEVLQRAIFALLHEPPSAHGFNRTTWRMCDLQSVLRRQNNYACDNVIREIIKNAGYRWRSAKVVLTSTDPDYRQKLEQLQATLGGLKEDERFFSIDEFGPFAVKTKPGRILAAPGEYPSVPQWQKSKGCLILTAALELSTNQVTHFYSTAKNTAEMIRMAELLVEQYRDCGRIFLSWDAASWHLSKTLIKHIEKHNADAEHKRRPQIELAPLPASAQFLNVIESVFSGMARAIIHSSDYQSIEDAKNAIDRYFSERNQHHRENPKRAGRKIWGLERVVCEFDPSNNCKDPAYR